MGAQKAWTTAQKNKAVAAGKKGSAAAVAESACVHGADINMSLIEPVSARLARLFGQN
jgi:hypothetical protein